MPPVTTDTRQGGVIPAAAAARSNHVRERHVWLLQACGFVLLVAALAAIVAMALRSGDADAWVAHTLETRRASGELFSTLQDAEASVRAYLQGNDPSLTDRFEAARDAVPSAEAGLRALAQGNPAETARLDALVPMIEQRLAGLSSMIALVRGGDLSELARRMGQRNGANLMAEIRGRLAAFDQAEADLLFAGEKAANRARTDILLASTGALSLALLLGGFTTLLSHRQVRASYIVNTQLAGTVTDRTDELRHSETRFRQVFHDSPIGLAIATAELGHIVAANPALCRMFGYTEAELIGRTRHELTHPDDPDIVVPVSMDTASAWRPIEKRYVTRSGNVLFARVGAVPLALPDLDEPLILATTEDITHEKAIEAALSDSEARMRLAVEAAGLGVWERDLRMQRHKIRLDARGAALSGGQLPADVWLDFGGPELTCWRALIHPDDAAAHADNVRALLTGTGDMLTDEYRVRRMDGSWSWISAFSTIAGRDPDTGKPTRVLTVAQDVTQRKESELALRHAQRMEAIGQLTGGVAHDFNNLLGAILGHAEFLLDLLPEHSEARELATEILDCTLNGAALTQRLLAFARRQPLQPAVIDLNEYLPVHVSLLQRTIGETVTVELALGPELWLTLADPSQIVDVLLNLAINARDAMPHGGKLTIATRNATLDVAYCMRNGEAVPGEYVVLSVADTGTGMTPAVLARATEPFFTTKPPGKGSGLGLSTIYGFARQSGGHLTIDSEPGKGTAVRLHLPRSLAEGLPAGVPKAHGSPLPRGGEAILVVDDNDNMRATAARNLAALGYRVRLAADGPAALSILRAGERIDLLFTDVVMPNGLSGYQLADTARALRPNLPVLFTSGFAAEDGGETDVMHPDALRKPYRRRELAERVRAELDG
jgi:PAS domain S-box-containing protein